MPKINLHFLWKIFSAYETNYVNQIGESISVKSFKSKLKNLSSEQKEMLSISKRMRRDQK